MTNYNATVQEIAKEEEWLLTMNEHDNRCGIGNRCKECTEGTDHTCNMNPPRPCDLCCHELTVDAYWGVDDEGNPENDLAVD